MSSGKPLNWNEWLWGKWRQHLLKQLFYHQLPISWDASMSGHGTPSKDATMNSFALESLQVCFVQKDNLPISINGCISWRNDIIFFSLLKAVDLINTPGKLSIMMHLFWENTTLRNQCFVDPLLHRKSMASCCKRSLLPISSCITGIFSIPSSNSSHRKTSTHRPFKAAVVLISCKYKSMTNFSSTSGEFPSSSFTS